MISLWLTLLSGAAAGLGIGYWIARKVWKRRADYWFNRCIDAEAERFRMVPRFDLHPLYHATRNYESVDALIQSVAALRERP